MRIPLHLGPPTYTKEDCAARVDLYQYMARLNPNGFRKPGKNSGQSRVEWMAQIAYGDAA